jgi:hypothetical protein
MVFLAVQAPESDVKWGIENKLSFVSNHENVSLYLISGNFARKYITFRLRMYCKKYI